MASNKIQNTKTEFCYQRLLKAIQTLEITPGERLNADEWATRLQTSVIPLREALRQLEQDGLVVIRPYAGARVTEVDLKILPEIFGFGEYASGLAAELACSRIEDAGVDVLRGICLEMESALDDPAEWGRANGQFHWNILKMAEMDLTLKTLERFSRQWTRIHNKYCASVSTVLYKNFHEDHLQILRAIEARDGEHAGYLARRHQQRVNQACCEAIEEAGGVTGIHASQHALTGQGGDTDIGDARDVGITVL